MPKSTKAFAKAAYHRQYNERIILGANLTLSTGFQSGLSEAVDRAGTSKGAYIKFAMMEKIEREG